LPDYPVSRTQKLLRRLRWPVVIAWLLAIVALNGLSSSLSEATNDTASAYLPAAAASTKVALLQQARSGRSQTGSAIVVAVRNSGLTPADRAALGAARTAVARSAGLVPGMAAPGALLPSPDGKAAVFSVSITASSGGENTDRDAVKAVRTAIAGPLGEAGAGLVFAVTGSAAIYADATAENQQTLLLLTR
jgi:putative drug exporter of the RND superfamily